MKKNLWLILGTMLAAGVSAQTSGTQPTPVPAPATPPAAEAIVTNAPPAAPQTNAPAAKSGKKKSATKKKAAPKPAKVELRTVPLVAGPAIVDASNVNVRGQSKLKSEVVTRLTKGDQVTVIEEVIHNNSGPDEPSAWAKIVLPPKAHVWINTSFIDSTNKTVIPKRLNVRGGPGENYSILGRMEHGDAVKEVGTKGDWTEIEPPTNAYAFMAAQYLKQEAPATIAATTTPPPATTEPVPTPTTVTEPPPVAPAPTDTAVTNPPAVTNMTSPVPVAATQPAADEPPPKRIVQHEGVVRGLTSIQAPTKFALISPDTGKTINYLYTTSNDLDLRRYKGLRIVVTGEEGLDERWGNTPVITIQKIQVVE